MKRKRFVIGMLLLAASPTLSILTGCATPAERAETRQKTRVEGRTEERQERRRD